MNKPRSVTAQNFRTEVLESDVPVLVDFWLNVDEHPELAHEYGSA